MAREVAFVLLQPDGRLAQQELLAQGEAIVSADVSDRDCAASLSPPREPRAMQKEAFGPIPRP